MSIRLSRSILRQTTGSPGVSCRREGEPAVTAKAGRTKGDEIVEGLRELIDVLRSGEPLASRFTVRTYKIAPPPSYQGAGVAGCASCS